MGKFWEKISWKYVSLGRGETDNPENQGLRFKHLGIYVRELGKLIY